jgi:hypothetical protein
MECLKTLGSSGYESVMVGWFVTNELLRNCKIWGRNCLRINLRWYPSVYQGQGTKNDKETEAPKYEEECCALWQFSIELLQLCEPILIRIPLFINNDTTDYLLNGVSWKVYAYSAAQGIAHILRNWMIQFRVHKVLPWQRALSQLDPVPSFTPHSCAVPNFTPHLCSVPRLHAPFVPVSSQYSLIKPCTSSWPLFLFPDQNIIWILHFPNSWYVSH